MYSLGLYLLRTSGTQTFKISLVTAITRGLDDAIVISLDTNMMANIVSAEALIGRDEDCTRYLRAYRAELISKTGRIFSKFMHILMKCIKKSSLSLSAKYNNIQIRSFSIKLDNGMTANNA